MEVSGSSAPGYAGPLAAARTSVRTGRIPQAMAQLAAVDRTGLDPTQHVLLGALEVELWLAGGDVAAADAAATALGDPAGGGPAAALSGLALGELSAAHGDHATAYTLFAAVDGLPDVGVLRPWRAGAALALVRTARRPEAAALAREQAEGATDAYGRAHGLRALAVAEAGRDPVGVLHAARVAAAEAEDTRLTAQLETDLAALMLLAPARHVPAEAVALLRAAEGYAAEERLWPLHARVAHLLTRAGQRPRALRGEVGALLTEAELRVARLAVEGRTNREIAERLGITLKGVESHLSRTYRKLGVSARADLAAVLPG